MQRSRPSAMIGRSIDFLKEITIDRKPERIFTLDAPPVAHRRTAMTRARDCAR